MCMCQKANTNVFSITLLAQTGPRYSHEKRVSFRLLCLETVLFLGYQFPAKFW